jgi:hypothetical protein
VNKGKYNFISLKVNTRILGEFFKTKYRYYKLASKIQKKIQKSVRFRFSTGTKSSKKQLKKTVKMYLVPATNLKNKKKFKVGSGYKIRGIPVDFHYKDEVIS